MPLLAVEEALGRILSGVAALGADGAAADLERVGLEAALARVAACPHPTTGDQPPFDASAMDGYAVRAGDVATLPARLKVIGQSAAGHPFAGSVGAGEAVRIFTGAPIPAGADAVVIQENARADGDLVRIVAGRPDPEHVRRRGSDFRAGENLIPVNTQLSPRLITLAAAIGLPALTVRRRPRVAILATGDELVPPGTVLAEGQIYASNHLGLAAMVAQAGGIPHLLGIAKDSEESLKAHIDRARDADVLVTIGGASVGDHDLVAPALHARGLALDFWRIAMRPGKPLMFGRLGAQRVLGLPGNPVSSLICARVFLVPLLRALQGIATAEAAGSVRAAVPLESNGPRTHYMRALRTIDRDGVTSATPVASQDSSLLSPLARADCLIVRPAGAPALSAGATVPVLPLDF